MDPHESLTDNTDSQTDMAAILTKACLTAKLLHEQQKEITQYERSKRIVRDRNLKFDQCPQVMKKIRVEIENNQAVAKDTKAQIKSMGSQVAKEMNRMLDSAVDFKSVFESRGFPTSSSDEMTFLDKQYCTDKINDLDKNIDTLISQKLDKADNEETIRNLIKQIEKEHQTNVEQSEALAKSTLQNIISELEDKGAQLQYITSDENVDAISESIFSKMMGLGATTEKKPMTVEDVPEFVQDCVRDHLGTKFIKQLLNSNQPISTIYPTAADNSIRSLQVRETAGSRIAKQDAGQSNRLKKSLYKVARMSKESDEALLLCETNLGSWPVQNVLKNLDHIDRVTRSHKQILDFINAPQGCSNVPKRHTYVDEAETKRVNELENIPPEISLFMNTGLSTALVTSLAEYTNQLYFSDLTQRVEELEKKLQ